MNHNLKKALTYMKLNPSLSFHTVGMKFHIDPSYLQIKWGELHDKKVQV